MSALHTCVAAELYASSIPQNPGCSISCVRSVLQRVSVRQIESQQRLCRQATHGQNAACFSSLSELAQLLNASQAGSATLVTHRLEKGRVWCAGGRQRGR
jgi:hypothetical protein